MIKLTQPPKLNLECADCQDCWDNLQHIHSTTVRQEQPGARHLGFAFTDNTTMRQEQPAAKHLGFAFTDNTTKVQ